MYPVAIEKVTGIMKFGDCINPRNNKKDFHTGMDFQAAEGEHIIAPESGVVIESKFDEKKGNYIVIKHSEMFSTEYYHLKNSIVSAGDRLAAGQTIGYVGKTGVAKGSHLHYEVFKNGKNVDPNDFLPKRQ